MKLAPQSALVERRRWLGLCEQQSKHWHSTERRRTHCTLRLIAFFTEDSYEGSWKLATLNRPFP